MENSCRCKICNVDVLRAAFAKHLRGKENWENEKQNEMIIPEWLLGEEQSPIRKKN